MSNIKTRRNADSATGLRRGSGMVTAPLLSLLVVPAAYALMRRRRATQQAEELQRT